MNGIGYTKRNYKEGNVLINGDLDVEGDVTIQGDLEVNGNITGFNISNEVVCLNRWYSTNQTGVFLPALPPATILKNNTSTLSNSGEKTVGNNVIMGDDLEDANSFAVMNLKILNRVENNAGGDNVNQFSIFLTTGGVTSDISWEEMNFGGFTLPFPGAYQNIEKTITFTKSAFNPNNIIVTVNCFKATNDRSQNVPTTTNTDKLFTSSNFLKLGSQNGNIIAPVSNSTTNNSTFILTGYTPGDDITVDIRVVKTNNAPNVIEANLEYGTLNVYKQQELPSGGGGGGSGDHLALTNLNAVGGSGFADAGHDLMFLSNASKPINGNYFLPTTDGGVAGGVLTTDGAGTTSFQTLSSGVTRAWVNKYSILTNPTFGAGIGIPSNLDSTGSGSKNYTDVNFPIGSQLHIQACGSWNINTTNLCGGQFVLAVGGGGFTITDVFELVAPVTTINEVDTGLGFWSVDVNIIRVGATTIRLGRVSANSRLTSTSTIDVPIVNSITNNPNGFTVGVPAFPFDIDLQWIDQSIGGQCFPVAGTYNHNVINANDTLAVTTNPSLDHNTLSNLTTGDPHSQYTKNGGRSGGQTLSGGLLGNNLVLKSHDISLPNVTIKPLNTQFNKNIDMDNNNIINANQITKTSPSGGNLEVINNDGPLVLSAQGGLSNIQLTTPNNVLVNAGLFEVIAGLSDFQGSINMNNNNLNNVLNINSGTNINLNPSGNVDINGDVDMGTNRIIGVPEIVGTGANMIIRNGGGESIILNSATNTIDILNNNLNMNNNQIDNVSVVNNSLGPLALIGQSLSSSVVIDPDPANSIVLGGPNDVVVSSNNDVNIISNAGIVNVNSNITNVNVGGTPRLTIDASEVGIGNTLNLNTNDIINGNFINANRIFCGDYETTTSFITFFGLGGIIPSFSSSGLDMNNGSINSVSAINGLTPVGGKYSQFTPDISVAGGDPRTSLINTGSSVGSNVFGVNEFTIGSVHHVLVKGTIETDAKEDLQIRILLGATVIFDTTLTEFADNAGTGYAIEIEVDIFCKTTGVAGVFYTNGQTLYVKDDNENSLRGKSSQTDSVIDTTALQTLDIDAVWGGGATANEILTSKTVTISKTY